MENLLIVSLLFTSVVFVTSQNSSCTQIWYGTAPFCDPQCPPNTEKVQENKCGSGACCWTGTKILCRECLACHTVYVGSVPYCSPDPSDCPTGYHATGESQCGDGLCCLVGNKLRCEKDTCH